MSDATLGGRGAFLYFGFLFCSFIYITLRHVYISYLSFRTGIYICLLDGMIFFTKFNITGRIEI